MTSASEFILGNRTKSSFVTRRKINLWIFLLCTGQEREEDNYSPPLANSTIVSGLEEAHISLGRTNYNCGGCYNIFNDEDDLKNHELDDHPLMCHICFNFFKDIDSRDKHYAIRHFGYSRRMVLYRPIWPKGSTESEIVIITIVCILLLHPNPNILLLVQCTLYC